MSKSDTSTNEIPEDQMEGILSNNQTEESTVQSCWQRTKLIFHFIWTYVKPPVVYIWDVAVDISRATHYFRQAHYAVGGISVGFIVAAILASMKYKWNNKDFRKNSQESEKEYLNGEENNSSIQEREGPSCGIKLLDSIVLAWYWRKRRSAWRSWEQNNKNEYMRDAALLGILENFLENGPQLTLSWCYIFRHQREIALVPSIIMKCDTTTNEITENQNEQTLPNVQIEESTAQSCWQRTKAKFHFIWTYVKPPIAYIWDVAIDISRTTHYFRQRDYAVGGISVGIIVAAILASMKYKWQMNNKDFRKNVQESEKEYLNGEENNSPIQEREEPSCGVKLLDSIVLVWYWRKLRSAWRSGELKSKNEYMRDTSLLGILENFLENGPQLNLSWFYVFWEKEEIALVPSIIMKSISLLVLTWSIPAYNKAVKRAKGEDTPTLCNMLLTYLWNVCQIVPRILILSMFAAEQPIPAVIYLSCHIVVMIIMLLCVAEENPDLCDSRCMQVLHCVVFGFMYIYTYIDIAADNHKVKATIIFYAISLAGNFFIVFYFLFTTSSFVFISIYSCGVVIMSLHYFFGYCTRYKSE